MSCEQVNLQCLVHVKACRQRDQCESLCEMSPRGSQQTLSLMFMLFLAFAQ